MSKAQYHHGDLRTAILDAAEQALTEKSLDALSMRELARKAGVSSGAPYYHFKDRSGLMAALCQRGFARLGDELQIANAQNGLQAMSKAYLAFAQKHPTLYQLMFSPEAAEGEGKALLYPYSAPVFDLLQEVILEETGSTDKRQANLTAISVWCFMHGAANLSIATSLQPRLGRKSLDKFAYETVRGLIEDKDA